MSEITKLKEELEVLEMKNHTLSCVFLDVLYLLLDKNVLSKDEVQTIADDNNHDLQAYSDEYFTWLFEDEIQERLKLIEVISAYREKLRLKHVN